MKKIITNIDEMMDFIKNNNSILYEPSISSGTISNSDKHTEYMIRLIRSYQSKPSKQARKRNLDQ